MQDQQLTCKDCGNTFTWTVGEQEFYKAKGFDNQPTRCPDCRKKRKAEKMGSRGDRGERKMYPAVCANCGKECMVPFQPQPGGKPVLCNDCYAQQRNKAA